MKGNVSLFVFSAIFFLAIVSSPIYAYEAIHGPTETIYYDKTKTFDGYNMFGGGGKAWLLDMEGEVVHTWNGGRTPRLLNNGNEFDADRKGFIEKNWDGEVVWQYTEKRDNYSPHHDWVRIFNKKLNAWTTMYIANKSISHEQAIAAGADPKLKRSFDGSQMDAIVEVDMDGNIVWEWWFFDHMIQDVDPTKANYVGKGKTIADYPGRHNINIPGRPLNRDYFHCNSMDYNAELDQVVTNSVQGEFWVVDHGNTFIPGDPEGSIALAAGPKGDFLYRWGDPARYGQGDPPSMRTDWTEAITGHKQIGGSHDIQWIKPGLPGAGNFLIFNNGQSLSERTPQSYIFEINGFLDANNKNTGNYVNPPDAGYFVWEQPREISRDTHKRPKNMSNQVVWTFSTISNMNFFSHIGSGAQRLPNGNTMICAMTEGHIFEVTREGECVWEYINPIIRDDKGSRAVKIFDDWKPMTNAVFRAYRYAADHPAFKGKDLKPMGKITDIFKASGPPRQRGDGEKGKAKGKAKGKK